MDSVSLRRAFLLAPEDTEYLDALGLTWEALIEGNHRWVLLYRFLIPEGYNTREADIAIDIPVSYPTTQLDMVYVFPALSLASGKQLKNTDVDQAIDGKTFQRWSRHRTQANPWRPNLDYLGTHIGLIDEWFSREIKHG